jgi:8-oxo-dGTP diphosphatase
MRGPVDDAHRLVERIRPFDEVERQHRDDALRWLESTDDVFRRAKPATPDRHLVSYVILADRANGSTLLVDHINAGLWLPPGGHVEPDKHPGETARREAKEELGVDLPFMERSVAPAVPSFITMTSTVGQDH